jgi:hypothetical protein
MELSNNTPVTFVILNSSGKRRTEKPLPGHSTVTLGSNQSKTMPTEGSTMMGFHRKRSKVDGGPMRWVVPKQNGKRADIITYEIRAKADVLRRGKKGAQLEERMIVNFFAPV